MGVQKAEENPVLKFRTEIVLFTEMANENAVVGVSGFPIVVYGSVMYDVLFALQKYVPNIDC